MRRSIVGAVSHVCPTCRKYLSFRDRVELLNHVSHCQRKSEWLSSPERAEKLKSKAKRKKKRQLLKANLKAEERKKKKEAERGLLGIKDSYIEKLEAQIKGLKGQVKSAQGLKTLSFYDSWEWCELRLKILNAYGAQCMCCRGTSSIQVDHIQPRSRFPELALSIENLQVLCKMCNRGKSNRLIKDYRPGNWQALLAQSQDS